MKRLESKKKAQGQGAVPVLRIFSVKLISASSLKSKVIKSSPELSFKDGSISGIRFILCLATDSIKFGLKERHQGALRNDSPPVMG